MTGLAAVQPHRTTALMRIACCPPLRVPAVAGILAHRPEGAPDDAALPPGTACAAC